MAERLDQPRSVRHTLLPRPHFAPDMFGRISEGIARFLGTPRFLLYLTLFCISWIAWNTLTVWVYDPPDNGFTALTLVLSLQASYAAPLILLAQNRQTDRDRVALEQDRSSYERNLADTEFLTREVASLRIALRDMATRDYLRSELRSLLDEMEQRGIQLSAEGSRLPPGDDPPTAFEGPKPT